MPIKAANDLITQLPALRLSIDRVAFQTVCPTHGTIQTGHFGKYAIRDIDGSGDLYTLILISGGPNGHGGFPFTYDDDDTAATVLSATALPVTEIHIRLAVNEFLSLYNSCEPLRD